MPCGYTRHMRIRHIEVFDAVYSSGSVTRAAERLNVSQPSVSKVLAHAEQQLGFPLFERVKGRLVPTPEADRLHQHVKRVNRHLSRLRQVAANLAESGEGHLRIASTPAFGMRFVPELVARWMEVSPGTQFSVETRHLEGIVSGLAEMRLDLGIAFQPQAAKGLRATRVGQGRFMVLAPPDFALSGRSALTLRDIERQPFIALDNQGPLGHRLEAAFRAADVTPKVVTQVETYHLARALAAEGVGLTITDEVTARSGGTLPVQVIPLEPELCFDIVVLQNADRPGSLLQQRFGRFVRTQLNDFLGRDQGAEPAYSLKL